MKVKLCGLRRTEDVEMVNEAAPDYAGFVFADSRRRVTVREGAALRARLAPGIQAVGVFVNESPLTVAQTAQAAMLDIIQLHGDEDADYLNALRAQCALPIWKAVRVRTADDIAAADALPVAALLLDSFSPAQYGGTGMLANLAVIGAARPQKPFFLAGGLRLDTVRDAVMHVRPDGVDLSGGFETDGVKDRARLKQLMEEIERCRQ